MNNFHLVAKMALLNAPILCFLASLASAMAQAGTRRQISQLRDSYDFIIAGAGTSGLTVADRLTEAFPDSKLQSVLASILSRHD
jgi:choline dehydrogenase